VDEVFRDALGKLKGRPLVGVIGSIGVRRDAKAVAALAKLQHNTDRGVAQAASRALGSIGNTDAAKALTRAMMADSTRVNSLARHEGLLRCAERLAADGKKSEAIGIYDHLRGLPAAHQVRAGAVRGAILTRSRAGVALLREYLQNKDYIMFSAAVQAAQEMKGRQVTRALTQGLNGLSADSQILIILTLGKRGDARALPTLSTLAKSGEKSVRVAAIKAMPDIGDASAVPVLVKLLADADGQITQAAKEALAALPGRQADAAVMAMLTSSETSRRLTALELIGRRRMTTSIPALLKAAGDANPKVRQAALRKVGELGSPAQLPALLDLLMDLKSSQDLNAAEQALSAVCAKADNPQSQTAKLTSLLTRANPAQKAVLLRVLGTIGGKNALMAVREAVKDSNREVSATAVRVLCGWKTADAAPDLLAFAKTSLNPSRKTAALRGYISLVRDKSLSSSQKLAMCKQAASLIQRDEEKKLLLGVLGTVPAAEALSMAMAHLDNAATKNEACFAAVAVSEKIVQKEPSQVVDAMQKVMRATDNRDVTRRARKVLNNAKKRI
jgi:HEAT repeat protein